MPSEEIRRAHVMVSGRVQKVGYRMSTWQLANRLKLGGWVRNLPDGCVEAVFEGPAATVQEMLDWCRQGPPAAIVHAVSIRDEPPLNESQFEVRS